MVCLSVLSVLSALLVPRLMEPLPNIVLEQQTQQLQALLHQARTQAMVTGRNAIVCPASPSSLSATSASSALSPGGGFTDSWCGAQGQWQTGVNVLLDSNQDGLVNEDDTLALQLNWRGGPGDAPRMQWRSFRDTDRIVFLTSGMTRWQNGRFLLCSPVAQIPGRVLVLNVAGRSYVQAAAPEDCPQVAAQ